MSTGHAPTPQQCLQLIETARSELRTIGNPAYLCAVVDADGVCDILPLVFSSAGPAIDHGCRASRDLSDGQRAVLVARQADASRLTFRVLCPSTMRTLHLLREALVEDESALADAWC
ncbi:hypothetical protein FSW04_14755 [Baekduia soli]|uniref:Uncharacterized protein n=1 Tax=Baekduia soli TaxID=496014 RepID=A0A5B8U6I2_9ACTN|nr:hypothetical protein [Baekduia soli]QEC48706.1 hypothetical protein FSW04_14755 [Baekduia soli]